MIPANFDYVRVTTLDDAVAALSEHGEDAKLLAGGHSLLPLMKLRFAFPTTLVDIGRVDALRGVRDEGEHLAIGAMTTHHDITSDDLVRQHCGLLADVAGVIGDPQVRHRGTIGGALAHGDAAGDLPATVRTLDAELVVQGPDGQRTVAAADFFRDYLETALDPDEVLVEIRVPKLDDDWGWNYQKFSRNAQAWAIVGACALIHRDNGAIDEARIGLTNMATVPVRAAAAEQGLQGQSVSEQTIADAAAQAADDTDPPSDLNADPAFRRHLAQVLTRRAVTIATGS